MAKIKFDQPTERLFETGVESGVLYKMDADGEYETGVAWNGLTSIEENPSGAEETTLYADNMEYASLRSKEKFGATINAYMYPDTFAECDGTKAVKPGVIAGQQPRSRFGLVYITKIGNDVKGTEYGYKIHIVYNLSASVSSKNHQTIGESPEAEEFSWEVTSNSIPSETENVGPLSTIVIDSTKFTETAAKAKLEALENTLFGTDPSGSELGTDPTLPDPKDVFAALA